MEYNDPHHHRLGDLQGESSGWLFKPPLAGAGAYWGGLIIGCTVCFMGLLPASRKTCISQYQK